MPCTASVTCSASAVPCPAVHQLRALRPACAAAMLLHLRILSGEQCVSCFFLGDLCEREGSLPPFPLVGEGAGGDSWCLPAVGGPSPRSLCTCPGPHARWSGCWLRGCPRPSPSVPARWMWTRASPRPSSQPAPGPWARRPPRSRCVAWPSLPPPPPRRAAPLSSPEEEGQSRGMHDRALVGGTAAIPCARLLRSCTICPPDCTQPFHATCGLHVVALFVLPPALCSFSV